MSDWLIVISILGGLSLSGTIMITLVVVFGNRKLKQTQETTSQMMALLSKEHAALLKEMSRKTDELKLDNQQWYKDFSIWLRRIDEKADPQG